MLNLINKSIKNKWPNYGVFQTVDISIQETERGLPLLC